MPPMPRIFVSIAAYRDPETPWTIRSLISRASHPERVTVGVCWQYRSPEDDGQFRHVFSPDQVRARFFDARDSRGAGWARSIAHGLREDEQYVLQVDSHMRFHRGWDDQLLRLLDACPSPRPVLSTYPPPYEPPDNMMSCGTFMLAPKQFDDHGILSFEGRPIPSGPSVPCAWIAGGFIFSRASYFDEVPYDPRVYFLGEEVSLAARGWTRGWDYFAPGECVMHHFYGRNSDPKHWGDHRGWTDANSVSVRRVRHLLGISRERDSSVIEALDGPLGLGDVRSLADYERFAGVSFSRRAIMR